MVAAGGGPPVRVAGGAVPGAVFGSPDGAAGGAGARLGATGVKGSRPGSDEAVVGELTTGAAGAETGTFGAGGVGLCAVVEQAAQYIARAARQVGAQTPRLRVGCIYTPTSTSINMYINILLDFQSVSPTPA